MGICCGVTGVGKTRAAKQYAQWEEIEPLLTWRGVVEPSLSPENPRPRTAVYTPRARVTPRQMEHEIRLLRWSLRVIGVDEVDRLKPLALEVLRDLHEESEVGMILLGLPGLERKLSRYAQVYGRVGFVHQMRALGVEEQRQILLEQVERISERRVNAREPLQVDQEALATMIRMTEGNFQRQKHVLMQIERIVQINPQVDVVSKEVVEAAREQLVYGRG
nr:AAA family ATPase [Dictyobacter alpinus]